MVPEPRELDAYFEALGDRQRRRVLLSLLRTGESPVDAARVVETGDVDETIPLYHVHLPKLADCGVVAWERGTPLVERGPSFEEIRPILEAIEETWEGADAVR